MKDKYKNLVLPDEIEKKLKEYGIKIRMPYKEKTSKDKQRKYIPGSKKLKKHRFSKYYYDLADFLNKKETILLGKKIRDDYWEKYNPLDKEEAIKQLKTIIGYHDLIKPKFSIKSSKTIKNRDGMNIEILDFKGRFNTVFKVYKSKNIKNPKGIVLAIHGRESGPDYVMRVCDKEDYSRSFGAYWLKKGYIVYAPQINWNKGLPMERLGYSEWGQDIAKLVDVLSYIKDNEQKKLNIIVAGISYGAHLSEILSIISSDINAVISIGGSARGDQFIRYLSGMNKINPEEKYVHYAIPPSYYFYYNGIGIFKLICPKPLIISIGTHDWGEKKFPLIFEAIDYYKSKGFEKNIELNIFKAYHESDPEGENLAYERLIEKNIFDSDSK